MGQQSNKIQKRSRRAAYLERKKAKSKESAALKPKARRVVKKAAAPAAAPAPETAPAAE